MTTRRGKEYTAYLRQAALEIVAGRKYLEARDEYRKLAIQLVSRTGCTYNTARQHIAFVLRRNRDPGFEPAQWGGAREGAGWPEGRARKTE